jgi:hypothetical protein
VIIFAIISCAFAMQWPKIFKLIKISFICHPDEFEIHGDWQCTCETNTWWCDTFDINNEDTTCIEDSSFMRGSDLCTCLDGFDRNSNLTTKENAACQPQTFCEESHDREKFTEEQANSEDFFCLPYSLIEIDTKICRCNQDGKLLFCKT